MFYSYFLKPLLFVFSPERAHHLSTGALKSLISLPGMSFLLSRWFGVQDQRLHRRVFGLDFPNPVGLAAGFDKNAEYIDAFAALGFGFIEIGTVTPQPQPGNDRPRLFRLIEDEAIINRMGFNNDGLERIKARLLERKSKVIVGGNLGKNKWTPNESALDDYAQGFEALYPVVDYFVVNVSSPNTPNLRALQEKEPLETLLHGLQALNRARTQSKPILLKIAPDLNESQLDDVLDIVQKTQLSGIIATNTTLSREGLKSDPSRCAEMGGLSGKPLRERATEVIAYLHRKSGGKLPIIGVGGIQSGEDALEKLRAGACLIQLYTGFIYQGPGLVKEINQKLLATAT